MSKVSKHVLTENAENCRRRRPHCRLTPSPRGIPANIPIPYTFGNDSFLLLIICVYLHSVFGGWLKTHIFSTAVGIGRSRSSRSMILPILAAIESAWLCLHLFWDGDLLAENCKFFLPLSHSALHSLVSLWNFVVKLTVKKLKLWSYPPVKISWILRQMFSELICVIVMMRLIVVKWYVVYIDWHRQKMSWAWLVS